MASPLGRCIEAHVGSWQGTLSAPGVRPPPSCPSSSPGGSDLCSHIWRLVALSEESGGPSLGFASGCCGFALGQSLSLRRLAYSLARWVAQNELVPNNRCRSHIPGAKQNDIRRCGRHTFDLFSHLTGGLTDLTALEGRISRGLESWTRSSQDLSDLVRST